MYNVTHEPELVKNFHSEYFKLLNFYHNTKRPSAFVKYYNINIDLSPSDDVSHVNFDKYTRTKSKWDLYELVPTVNLAAIQNATTPVVELAGNIIEGNTSIVVYTLDEPHVDDLITFYDPVESEEVYRVTNVRLQINSLYSNPEIKWFELDLNTAPIKYDSLGSLPIGNHYVYDLSLEKNILYPEYKEHINNLNIQKEAIEKFIPFYSCLWDLYHAGGHVPAITNELIYFFKKNYNTKYNRLYENIYAPYGYWDKFGALKFNDISEVNFDTFRYDVYDMTSNLWYEYEWEYDDYTSIDDMEILDKIFYLTYMLKQNIVN